MKLYVLLFGSPGPSAISPHVRQVHPPSLPRARPCAWGARPKVIEKYTCSSMVSLRTFLEDIQPYQTVRCLPCLGHGMPPAGLGRRGALPLESAEGAAH